jgi:sulfur transfer complex TusBCD TusB component (DsrH family)
MEYVLGSFITLLSLFIFSKMTKKITSERILIPIFTQSRKVLLIKNYISNVLKPEPYVKTQSKEYAKKNSIKAFFLNDNVYWIENGFLVMARLTDTGIDETTKKRVDTHSLDKVELDKISFIVDKLTEGNEDDSRNSGK